MLDVARAALHDAELIEADAGALPFPDGSIDLITCVTALHLIPDTAGAIAEWRRLLRAGGRAVTATVAQDLQPRDQGAPRPYPVDHGPFGSQADLERTAAAHGFTISGVTEWRHETVTLLIAQWVVAHRVDGR